MKLFNSLEVYVEIEDRSVRAGVLSASFGGGRNLGSTTFVYDRDYFRTPGAYELDPKLPRSTVATRSGEDQRLFGAFQDLTPDDWGRRVINANLANARQRDSTIPGFVDEFDYLALAADATRLGAIRFRGSATGEWLGPSKVVDLKQYGLDAYAEAAARLEMHEATAEDLELLGAPGTSAGGARPKVSVYMDGELRLLKLPSERDSWRDGEAWEYVAISLARAAGITVQSGELLRTSDGKSTLALRRFDRNSQGGRIGYMSARTAMEISDQGHSQFTYEDFADVTDSATKGDSAQLRDLFKRVALNVLISNDDDHWKNHGFLRDGDSWTLSPAFDINPSIGGSSINSRQISSKDDPRRRDIRNLIDTATTYKLAAQDTSIAIAEVVEAVKEWPAVARAAGISQKEIDHMSRAFSEDQMAYAQATITSAPRRVTIDLEGTISENVDVRTGKSGEIWVQPHMRNGRQIAGFWRHRSV